MKELSSLECSPHIEIVRIQLYHELLASHFLYGELLLDYAFEVGHVLVLNRDEVGYDKVCLTLNSLVQ